MLALLATITWTGAQAQVVYREYLSQNHEGTIENSVNYNGRTLAYQWEYVDMEKGQHFAEPEAIQRIIYRLNLSVDGRPVGHFDLQMRDLIVSYYVEINATKDEDSRTIMALYHKANRWARLKGVPHLGCRREGVSWGRMDTVKSYEELMHFIVQQLDKNIDFNCYL